MKRDEIKGMIVFIKGTLTEMVSSGQITADEAKLIAPILIQEQFRKECIEL